jgi:hypothetical protein
MLRIVYNDHQAIADKREGTEINPAIGSVTISIVLPSLLI